MLTFHYECVSQLETKIVQSFIHVDVWFFHLFFGIKCIKSIKSWLEFQYKCEIRMPQTSKWNAIIKQWLHGSY